MKKKKNLINQSTYTHIHAKISIFSSTHAINQKLLVFHTYTALQASFKTHFMHNMHSHLYMCCEWVLYVHYYFSLSLVSLLLLLLVFVLCAVQNMSVFTLFFCLFFLFFVFYFFVFNNDTFSVSSFTPFALICYDCQFSILKIL